MHEELEAARARLAAATGSSAGGAAADRRAGHGRGRVRRGPPAAGGCARGSRSAGSACSRTTLAQRRRLAVADEPDSSRGTPMVVALQREVELARAERRGGAQASARRTGPGRCATASAPATRTWCPSASASRCRSRRRSARTARPPPSSRWSRRPRPSLPKRRARATADYRALASDAERLQRPHRALPHFGRDTGPTAHRGRARRYRSNQVPLTALFEARHAEVEAQRKLLALQRDLAKVQAQLAFKPLVRRRRPMKRTQLVIALVAASASLLAAGGFYAGRAHAARRTTSTAAAAGSRRVGRRAQGALLARPDGAGPALRQAGQVAVHGHAARAGLCRRGQRLGREGQPDRPAEPRHPHGSGAARPTCRRRSTRSARCSSTSA